MRKLLLAAAMIEGGLVMLLELSIPHVITPVLGNSVFMWAILISLSVLSLAIGYFLGGFLAKKVDQKLKVLINLFAISTLFIFCSWLSILGLNSNSSINDFLWTYLSIGLGLVMPLILFGATTPLIISIIQDEKEFEAGKVYSISTVGGLIFALFTGFVFIPELGLSKTLLFAVFLDIAVLILLLQRSEKKWFFRTAVILELVVLVLLFVKKEFPEDGRFQVLYYSEGINGQLMVSDIKGTNGTDRILFINRMGQTWINRETDNSIWSYPNLVTSLGSVYPQNSNVLLLGLGGGIVAKQLNQMAGMQVDVVELDSRIIDISYEYFNLPRRGVEVFAEDARTYLNRCEEKYDVMIFDVFNGEIAPSHALSAEAFKRADELLNEKGLVIINFNGFTSGIEARSGQALVNTLKAAGFIVKMLPSIENKEEDRNIIYVAYHQEPNWEKARVTINIATGKFDLKNSFKVPEQTTERVITDDFPVMEQLNLPAAKKWRESYYTNFTKKFKKEEGIFYIK